MRLNSPLDWFSAGLSAALWLTWLLTLAALPAVTIVCVVCHRWGTALARELALTAFGMAVACAVFPLSGELATHWRLVPLLPITSFVLHGLIAVSLVVAIPCGIIGALVRHRTPSTSELIQPPA